MNDKKKLMVVLVLVAVVLGVGAFQFVQMSSGPAKPQATAKRSEEIPPDAGTQETPPDVINEIYKIGSARDPFLPGTLDKIPGTEPPVVKPEPPPRATIRGGGSYRRPPEFEGQDPLWKDGLPQPGTDPKTLGGSPNLLPIKDPNAFNFTVSGVITGARPAAVFVDDKGNQRLITLGGSYEEGSQLIAVERGRVTVRHKGKTQTINVGGTPNVK